MPSGKDIKNTHQDLRTQANIPFPEGSWREFKTRASTEKSVEAFPIPDPVSPPRLATVRLDGKAKWIRHPLLSEKFGSNEQRVGNMLHSIIARANQSNGDYACILSSGVARSMWGRNYKEFIDYLKELGWIKVKHDYHQQSGRARVYELMPALLTQWEDCSVHVVDCKLQLKALKKARRNHTKQLKRSCPAIRHCLDSEEILLGYTPIAAFGGKVGGRTYSNFSRFAKGLKEQCMVSVDGSRLDHWDLVNAHPSMFVDNFLPERIKNDVFHWFLQKKHSGQKAQIHQLLKSNDVSKWKHFAITKEFRATFPTAYCILRNLKEQGSLTKLFERLETQIINLVVLKAKEQDILVMRKGDQVTCKQTDRQAMIRILEEVEQDFEFIKFANKYFPEVKKPSYPLKPTNQQTNLVEVFASLLVRSYKQAAEPTLNFARFSSGTDELQDNAFYQLSTCNNVKEKPPPDISEKEQRAWEAKLDELDEFMTGICA